jgi:regulator of RNase E activity RraA
VLTIADCRHTPHRTRHTPHHTTPHHTTPHTRKHTAQGVPVVIGGCTIKPGDWVYADPDGVIVAKEKLTLP